MKVTRDKVQGKYGNLQLGRFFPPAKILYGNCLNMICECKSTCIYDIAEFAVNFLFGY